MPRVKIFYAVKSAISPEIIKAIDKHVHGYDIASLGEFQLLSRNGVSSDRLLFSNPVKDPRHIKITSRHGVNWYSFDSDAEIDKLAEHAPQGNVYLRLLVSDQGSKFPLSRKFGIEPAYAVEFAQKAVNKGLNVRGLTFHVGSQSVNPESWENAISLCGDLIKKLKKVGCEIDTINIGGGFPARYDSSHVELKIIAKTINKSLNKYIPKNVEVFAEPGRYISAESALLVSSIIGHENRAGSKWLFLDMGVFQGLIEPLEMPGIKFPVISTKLNNPSELVSYTLTGPTCDACDTIGDDYKLPENLTVGDKICLLSTGAYTDVYESSFNGFKPPKKYYIQSDREFKDVLKK